MFQGIILGIWGVVYLYIHIYVHLLCTINANPDGEKPASLQRGDLHPSTEPIRQVNMSSDW